MPFHPPFCSHCVFCSFLSFLVAQTILTSYIPVYLYSYTLLLFLPVLHFLLVRLVPPQRRNASRCSLFPRLVRVLPGIVWPDFWSSVGGAAAQSRGEEDGDGGGGGGGGGCSAGAISGRGALGKGEESAGGEQRQDRQESVGEQVDLSPRVHSSRQLLKPDDIAASLMHHTAVLLTFGLTNPVLAVAVTCTICLQTAQWVMLLNRFVFKRLLLGGMWGAHAEGGEVAGAAVTGNSNSKAEAAAAAAAAASSSLWRDEVVGEIMASIERERRAGGAGAAGSESKRSTRPFEELDICLRLVETSVQNFEALLSLCILPVVAISCVFFVFFSWDIAADRLGFAQSLWVPLIAAVIPFLLVWLVKKNVF